MNRDEDNTLLGQTSAASNNSAPQAVSNAENLSTTSTPIATPTSTPIATSSNSPAPTSSLPANSLNSAQVSNDDKGDIILSPDKPSSNKRKPLIIALIAIAVVAVLGLVAWLAASSSDNVSPRSVAGTWQEYYNYLGHGEDEYQSLEEVDVESLWGNTFLDLQEVQLPSEAYQRYLQNIDTYLQAFSTAVNSSSDYSSIKASLPRYTELFRSIKSYYELSTVNTELAQRYTDGGREAIDNYISQYSSTYESGPAAIFSDKMQQYLVAYADLITWYGDHQCISDGELNEFCEAATGGATEDDETIETNSELSNLQTALQQAETNLTSYLSFMKQSFYALTEEFNQTITGMVNEDAEESSNE